MSVISGAGDNNPFPQKYFDDINKPSGIQGGYKIQCTSGHPENPNVLVTQTGIGAGIGIPLTENTAISASASGAMGTATHEPSGISRTKSFEIQDVGFNFHFKF